MMNDIDRIREALQFISTGGHDERFRIGCMVKSELGDTGRDLWDEWRDGRGDDEAASVWKSISEAGALKIGTLFHEAKANGWRDDGAHQKPTPEKLAERRRIAAERAAKEEAEIARERADTAKNATAILKAKATTEAKADNPYLVRKRVPPVATLREIDAGAAAAILGYAPNCRGELLVGRLLVVPVKQGDGLSTLELIDGDKRKAALAGRGSKVGGYWATERLPDGNGAGLTLLIGEGVATVLSASEATGHPAIAALSSGNLPAVAKAMRERYPEAVIVILADLVKATGEPDPHAIEAAKVGAGRTAIPDFGSNRDPDMKDMNDLFILGGAEAVAQAIANASAPDGAESQANERNAPADDSDGNGWPDPHPLTAKIEPEPYPLDALPLPIRAAVEEVVGFVKAPVSMVASSSLAALSLAIQAHVDVKRLEKLHGPVGLFLLTIADSGERKSTCDGFFTKTISDYEEAQAEAAKPALKDHRAAIEAWEAKRGGVKEKIRQLAKEQKSTAGMESALRDLEYDKPEPPRIPRLLYADATPEAQAYCMAKQWPSGGVVSAEGGIVFGSHGMGKDSVMRNLGLLNQLWDGKSLTIDRRSTESFTVRGARLTVALQVQEPTLREFFTRSGALARGTGFLARFLVAWPESTQGMRQIDPDTPDGPATWPHLATFHRRIAAILDQPVPIDEDGALTPPMLPLTPEAKAAWVEYHNAIESELSSGGELYDVRDVASKSADNAARLAALFQMFEGAGGAIGLAAFESASLIAAWHLHESRRFFGELALPVELADAARLDGWLIQHCRRERTHLVSTREAQRLGPIRDKEKLAAALRELEELDRVKVAQEGRRKTIKVNPALLGVVP
jgi:putative DNA primase/helicase